MFSSKIYIDIKCTICSCAISAYNYLQFNNDKHTRTSHKSSDKRERTLGASVLVGEGIFWVLLCIQLEIYVVYEGIFLAEVGVISY
jgi:hypothetical protein